MNKTEQTYIDKTSWPNGQWQDEPDRISWVDPETGYHCLIKRGPVGALCGYVALEKSHPYYEKKDNDIDWQEIEVHGGLTYSEHCNGDAEFGICHLTENNDEAWWFGFDCAHLGDFAPAYESHYNLIGYDVYKNVQYVTSQVTSLARQLKEKEQND